MGQIRCDTAKKKGTEGMNDPYQVLGVSPNATDAEVKAAYRRLAKEYHPDRNGGSAEAEKKMMQINDAYTQIVEMRKNGSSYSYGGYSQGWGGSSQAQQQAPEFSHIRQMLQQYRWQEALQALETMENRNAEWYYLYARGRQGLGDDIAALNFARLAVSMDPNNLEYYSFLQQLTMGGQQYRQQSVSFGGIQDFLCRNPFLSCLLFNLCCGGCGGARFCCC